MPLAYLPWVPVSEKWPEAAAACGAVNLREGVYREEKGEEEKKGEVLQRKIEQNWVKTQ